MDKLNKVCWTKYTSFKILGFKIFEKEEILDSSTFEEDKNSAYYLVPNCFNNFGKRN